MIRNIDCMRTSGLISCFVVAATFGCAARGPKGPTMSTLDNPPSRGATGGSRVSADLTIVDQSEVDLVESLTEHRAAYRADLERLREFYQSKGYATKLSWAEFELKGLRAVKSFRYLLDAEIPSGELRPMSSIDDADALYAEGVALMKKAGAGAPILYREDQMVQAADMFRRLIEKYPGSDKIDDAAFQLGEIHKDYLHNTETLALKWYERAFEWDPKTPHPARFQAAVTCEYRLHDRDRALELYQMVIRDEEAPESNQRFAMGRVHELTKGQRTAEAGR